MIGYRFKYEPAPEWIRALVRQVIERDGGLCVLCGRVAVDPHHIIPRSRGKKWSKKLWRIENMACLCRGCHKDGQTTWMRAKLLERMALNGYDMQWVMEFGIEIPCPVS